MLAGNHTRPLSQVNDIRAMKHASSETGELGLTGFPSAFPLFCYDTRNIIDFDQISSKESRGGL